MTDDKKSAQTSALENDNHDDTPSPFAIPTIGVADTIHIGAEDLPWIEGPSGELVQLLQVDLSQGFWLTRTRFPPGATLDTHYHTGQVLAVTLSGRWWYKETPEQINTAGSYLYEPAMSVHTLTVDPEQKGYTEALFAVTGSNINLDSDGNVTSVLDAHNILKVYREACDAQQKPYDALIVVGENLQLQKS